MHSAAALRRRPSASESAPVIFMLVGTEADVPRCRTEELRAEVKKQVEETIFIYELNGLPLSRERQDSLRAYAISHQNEKSKYGEHREYVHTLVYREAYRLALEELNEQQGTSIRAPGISDNEDEADVPETQKMTA